MNEITINDIIYVPKTLQGDMRIVVLDRGFVYVGQVQEEDDRITIHNARCIIRWGTTKHLGELASGPLDGTELGDICTVECYKHSVIHMIEAHNGWE